MVAFATRAIINPFLYRPAPAVFNSGARYFITRRLSPMIQGIKGLFHG